MLQASKIWKHHVYGGTRAGSLYNVYVGIEWSDGSRTRGGVEPSELLTPERVRSRRVAGLCGDPQGQGDRQVPSICMSMRVLGARYRELHGSVRLITYSHPERL